MGYTPQVYNYVVWCLACSAIDKASRKACLIMFVSRLQGTDKIPKTAEMQKLNHLAPCYRPYGRNAYFIRI